MCMCRGFFTWSMALSRFFSAAGTRPHVFCDYGTRAVQTLDKSPPLSGSFLVSSGGVQAET